MINRIKKLAGINESTNTYVFIAGIDMIEIVIHANTEEEAWKKLDKTLDELKSGGDVAISIDRNKLHLTSAF